MTPWERARGFVLPALKDESEADLLHALRSGHAKLWLGERSALVTQTVESPRSIHAWLAGGDLQEIATLVPGMEGHARALGCEYASITGRRGWARVLSPMGYRPVDGELRKSLNG